VQIAEVFAIKSSKNKVAILFVVGDETQWSKVSTELLDWNDTVWWISANNPLRAAGADDGGMRLALHLVKDLPISEEKHDTVLDHILENEVFIVVTLDEHVGEYDIIDCCLPLLVLVIQRGIVVHLLLCDVRI
jgi:hypothetical protein